jgi:hydroxymethylpyrimidine/phosphomethylpyrimidine kinase
VQRTNPAIVAAQVDAIATDFRPAAWKTGMLVDADIIAVVAERLRHHRVVSLVVDPVMIAKSGDALLAAEAVATLEEQLLPLALVLTPNLPEAEAILRHPVEGVAGAREAAAALAAMGPRVVVVKGGHGEADPVTDVVFDRETGDLTELVYARVPGTSTHGTGCTLSAAIAARLARGEDAITAIKGARAYLQQALEWAPGLGAGHGPLGHFGPPGTVPIELITGVPRDRSVE